MIDFILASGSPRRKELLELMGLEFKADCFARRTKIPFQKI